MIDSANVGVEVDKTIVRMFRSSCSQPEIGVILGRLLEDGMEQIYLDRRIHRLNDSNKEWAIDGAYTTILSRPVAEKV